MKNRKINWNSEIKLAVRKAFSGLGKIMLVILNILITLILIAVLTGIIVGCAFTIYIKNYVDTTVDISLFNITASEGTTSSAIYRYEFTDRINREGTAVLMEGERIVGSSSQEYVTYDRIPENMINAVIAIEDKRFKTHEGVDWKRTLGAGVNFFIGFDGSYGGSTLTQQLIKNITGEDDYSIQRKVQEIFWALDLETKKDKEEILELYLNIANFGSTYYGVQAAAYNYFSKDVSELTLLECAAIAGITQNPSYYNPMIFPEHNATRRDTVLYEMLDQGLITQREFNESFKHELVLNPPSSTLELTDQQAKGISSWYTDMVIEDVISDLMTQKGYSYQAASVMVYNGGLRIYSLIDEDVQAQLEKVYLNDNNFPKATSGLIAQSSAIVIDPYTGDVLGVVGARRKKSGNRVQNFATMTKRPPGSAIKPLSVYSPSFDSGLINWATVIEDSPFDFVASATGWPKNAETFGGNSYRGLTNIYYALTHSLNTIPVKILSMYGLQNSYNYCTKTLHMTDILAAKKTASGKTVTDIGYAALGLGQLNYGISLRQLTAGYSIFPNAGIFNDAHSYLRVTDSEGNVILENGYSGKVAIKEETASVMNLILANVTREGTAKDLSFGKLTGIDVAGKTGTAGDSYDRWFIGYTPYYICGIWYGYEYPKTLTGSNPCIPLWDDIMIPLHQKYLTSTEPLKTFGISPNLVQCTYCKDSGKLCSDACALDPRGDRSETGYFIRGTEPTSYCDTHIVVDYDSVTKCIACDFCPPENIVQVALVKVNRDFNARTNIPIQDAQYSYMELPYDVRPYGTQLVPYYHSLNYATVVNGKTVYHQRGYTRNTVHFNSTCLEHFDYAKWRENVDRITAERAAASGSSLTGTVSLPFLKCTGILGTFFREGTFPSG